MTEKELRQKVCDQARYWLGRKESDGSHRVIIDVYNAIPIPGGYRMTYNDPWCAAYVSAVGAACGLSDIIYPDCGCDSMIRQYQQHGRWQESDAYRPQPGDVIFYDWDDNGAGDNRGGSDHVGLVLSTTGSTISVIEGNTSDMVAIRTRTVDQMYIRGYGLPDYASKAGAQEEPEECTLRVPKLTIGDGTNGKYIPYVLAAQALLLARGYSCGGMKYFGKEYPDGEFGAKTMSSVGKLQKASGLPATGDVDEATWPELFNF